VTDITCSGTAGCVTVERWASVTGAAWLFGDANATIATPAARTIAALQAVRAAPRRRFNRDPLGLASAVPSQSSIGCCLRNQPDRDTVRPFHEISQLDNGRKADFGTGQGPGKVR
jgi:hypothetical protein